VFRLAGSGSWLADVRRWIEARLEELGVPLDAEKRANLELYLEAHRAAHAESGDDGGPGRISVRERN